MRGLGSTCAALVLITSASGCALIDGLSGGGDDDDTPPACVPQEVVRGFDFATSEIVSTVQLTNTITHPSPWQIVGEVRHNDVTSSFVFDSEGSTLTDVSGDFAGADALGQWFVALRDTEQGDEGSWDGLNLVICTTMCATGEDLTPMPLPDCAPGI